MKTMQNHHGLAPFPKKVWQAIAPTISTGRLCGTMGKGRQILKKKTMEWKPSQRLAILQGLA